MDDTLDFLAACGPVLLAVVMSLDPMAVPVPPEPFLLGAGDASRAGPRDAGGVCVRTTQGMGEA